MIIYKDWFISSVGVVLLVCSFAVGSDLTFTLKPSAIKPGEHAVLEIYLPLEALQNSMKGADEVTPTINDDWLRQVKSLKILSVDNRRETDKLIWRYELTSYQEGKVTLPPLNLQVGENNFSTRAVSLEVSATRAQTDNELRPEFEDLGYPRHWGRYFLYALLAGGAVAFVAWGRKHIPQLKRPTPVAIVPPPPRPVDPQEWLKEQLERLKGEIADEKYMDHGVDELTRVLRRYFSLKLGKPVESWTSREFKALLASDATARDLSRVFEQCDEFKFREDKPTDVRAKAVEWLQESERILFHVAIS